MMNVSKRARDAHDLKELCYMLDGLFSIGKKLRILADDIDTKALLIQSKLRTMAEDRANIIKPTNGRHPADRPMED